MQKFLLWLFFVVSSSLVRAGDDESLMKQYGTQIKTKVTSTLRILSDKWDYKTLESELPNDVILESKDIYKQMVDSASTLGKFKTCKELSPNMIDEYKDIEKSISISGSCEYENGYAIIVSHVFIKNGEANFMFLVVIPE